MNRRRLLASLPAVFVTSSLAAADSKLRVAIIGHTGRGSYGHGLDTMWLKIPTVEIAAVADADEKGLAGELKKLGVSKGFADYKAMLSETKPDLVAIGPRHIDQHRDMLLAAIQAGAKGVYIEKPFCRSLEEVDEVIAAADKAGTKIAIAHRNRYHPALPVVAKLIQDGVIGRVLEMRGRGKEDTRGGSLDLWVLGCHIFNLATFFGGAPQACSATVLQAGNPVTKADVKEGDEGIGSLAGNEVHARFELAGGMPLFFDSIQSAGTKEAGFGLQIIGTKGIIDFRIDKEPVAHLCTGSPFDPAAKEPRKWVPITTAGVDKAEPIADLGKKLSSHEAAGLDLIAAIQEKRAPLCNAAQGRETIEMISAIFESHRLNGQRVAFPLKTRVNPLTLL
ncbi:Gfo/Idh/MocA family protein [Prosthecobacter vanneervenii]|uniref:Putative dehydrogenase n=1 Tax=Prosthecobacter vanneervenii TaxID=48466 RepID=A0A7W7YGD3_9BACT|nr:Gfo/Idh/MocA family oxidoreductase [Prosthecobacter vanneervenii]MBB5035502.1 putative dehydrogenase [Prosthecobacter vanneervenii]